MLLEGQGQTVIVSKETDAHIIRILADTATVALLRSGDIKIIDKGANESDVIPTADATNTRQFILKCNVIAIENPFANVPSAEDDDWCVGNDAASKKTFFDFLKAAQPGQPQEPENLIKDCLILLEGLTGGFKKALETRLAKLNPPIVSAPQLLARANRGVGQNFSGFTSLMRELKLNNWSTQIMDHIKTWLKVLENPSYVVQTIEFDVHLKKGLDELHMTQDMNNMLIQKGYDYVVAVDDLRTCIVSNMISDKDIFLLCKDQKSGAPNKFKLDGLSKLLQLDLSNAIEQAFVDILKQCSVTPNCMKYITQTKKITSCETWNQLVNNQVWLEEFNEHDHALGPDDFSNVSQSVKTHLNAMSTGRNSHNEPSKKKTERITDILKPGGAPSVMNHKVADALKFRSILETNYRNNQTGGGNKVTISIPAPFLVAAMTMNVGVMLQCAPFFTTTGQSILNNVSCRNPLFIPSSWTVSEKGTSTESKHGLTISTDRLADWVNDVLPIPTKASNISRNAILNNREALTTQNISTIQTTMALVATMLDKVFYPHGNGLGSWLHEITSHAAFFVITELQVSPGSQMAIECFMETVKPCMERMIQNIQHGVYSSTSTNLASIVIPQSMCTRVNVALAIDNRHKGLVLAFKNQRLQELNLLETLDEVSANQHDLANQMGSEIATLQESNEELKRQLAFIHKSLKNQKTNGGGGGGGGSGGGGGGGGGGTNAKDGGNKRKRAATAKNRTMIDEFRKEFKKQTGCDYQKNFKHPNCTICIMSHLLGLPCYVTALQNGHWKQFPAIAKTAVFQEFKDLKDLIQKFQSNPGKYKK